jgi:hypothetical protein
VQAAANDAAVNNTRHAALLAAASPEAGNHANAAPTPTRSVLAPAQLGFRQLGALLQRQWRLKVRRKAAGVAPLADGTLVALGPALRATWLRSARCKNRACGGLEAGCTAARLLQTRGWRAGGLLRMLLGAPPVLLGTGLAPDACRVCDAHAADGGARGGRPAGRNHDLD